MKRRDLDPTTQVKLLQILKNLLRCFKNFVIDEMKADGVKFPKPVRKPVRVIGEKDLRVIFQTADTMPGWRGTVAWGMFTLYFSTGVRPKELRLAQIDDLDLERMTIFIRHPKGESSWASVSPVDLIRPDMVPIIHRYLGEREKHLRKHGLDEAEPLFPSIDEGKAG